MKRILSVLFFIGFLTFLTPVKTVAQDDIAAMVTEEMTSYYKDLVKIDQQIVTAEDAERLENRYKNQLKLVESCFNDYTEIFRYDKKLYAVYENYTDLYQQVGKRIEELKAEKEQQEKLDKLTGKFNRYLDRLTNLEAAGNRCVSNKLTDSLKIVQEQARDCYEKEANKDYVENSDFIEEDENLSQMWQQTKDIYARISALEIQKSPFNLTTILEIMGIIAAVVLIVTMISSKIKAAKLSKPNVPKAPKKSKKDEDLPSI